MKTNYKNGQNQRTKKLTMISAIGMSRSKKVALFANGFANDKEVEGFYSYLFWLAYSSLRFFSYWDSSLTTSLMTHSSMLKLYFPAL